MSVNPIHWHMATVVQTQFGIRSYSAMLDALEISDEVEIRASLTLSAS